MPRPPPSALANAEKTLVPGAYEDVHCNILDDQEFLAIYSELVRLGFIKLSIAQFFETERHTNEFVVQLRA